MQNEILNHRILRELRAGPKASGQIARALNHNAKEVRQALYDLMDAGRVSLCIDEYRYELSSGGYSPEPGPEVA